MIGMRLDTEMVSRKLVTSREKARALIMAGEVSVNGKKADKAGYEVKPEDVISILTNPIPFVSRGGLKLDKAVRTFGLSLAGKKCIDVGASTGGFTDCMLQNGAAHVHALDVGYGQLDWKLRNSSDVTVMERTNARYMVTDWFPYRFDFASIDVSFISLRLILPPLYECLGENAEVVALIKPQFEAERSEIGKKGVVKDEKVHIRVCSESMKFAETVGFSVCGLSYSPIKGPEGNIEFLMYLRKSPEEVEKINSIDIAAETIVKEAHASQF